MDNGPADLGHSIQDAIVGSVHRASQVCRAARPGKGSTVNLLFEGRENMDATRAQGATKDDQIGVESVDRGRNADSQGTAHSADSVRSIPVRAVMSR